MLETDPTKDLHIERDFADTSIESVKAYVGHTSLVEYHQGLIPETFQSLKNTHIAFAHIDVDIYRSNMDCCSFIYPRLSVGGFMVFDDYGFPSCPGARMAVDEFFKNTRSIPLVLPTGQATVFSSNGRLSMCESARLRNSRQGSGWFDWGRVFPYSALRFSRHIS